MIVLLNATDGDLAEAVAAALAARDWSAAGRVAPEIRPGRWDDPEPLRRWRRREMARDPESYVFRLRQAAHPAAALQDEAATRGDLGLVIEVADRSAATLAEDIAACLLEEVRLSPPDPSWPARFEEERRLLERACAGAFVGVHHVGSTAVADLPAKPVIDLLAELPALEDFPPLLGPLLELGYAFMDYPENFERRFCRKGRPRTHHLHVVEVGSAEARDKLDFRDALRADRSLREAYAELKRELAGSRRRARAAYADGKSEFVADALRAWRARAPR